MVHFSLIAMATLFFRIESFRGNVEINHIVRKKEKKNSNSENVDQKKSTLRISLMEFLKNCEEHLVYIVHGQAFGVCSFGGRGGH